MASLNGVSIKNLKDFEGREGVGSQATVYLNGTKIGFWSDSANGGCHDFDFNTNLLSEAFYKMKSSLNGGMKDYYNIDCFMVDVLALTLLEKDYKKFVKKGYPVLLGGIVFGGSCAFESVGCKVDNGNLMNIPQKDEIVSSLLQYAHGEEVMIMICKDLEAFNMQRGTENGLKIEKEKQLKQEKENRKRYEEEEKQRKTEEQKLKNNNRFLIEDLGNRMKITDKTINKSTIVPVFAFKETMRVLMELYM